MKATVATQSKTSINAAQRDCYEAMLQQLNSVHALIELGSIADFNLQLEPESYTQIFIALESMVGEVKELAAQLEKAFFK